MKKDKTSPQSEAKKYTKQQLIDSRQYASVRDMLEALLDSKKLYTKDEVNQMISNFLRGVIR